MKEMSSYERFRRTYAHQEADRIPLREHFWGGAIKRWRREGMPENMTPTEFFGLDRWASFLVDNSPRLPESVIEQTPEYRITKTSWGATVKWMEDSVSIMDYTITDRDIWRTMKERIAPARDRIPEHLRQNYRAWREQGYWIYGELWFGFDVTHSWIIGTDRMLIAMVEDPEWCQDLFGYLLDVGLAVLDMAWDEGYRFDCLRWPDDMGFKGSQFFSMDMYRSLLKPFQKKAVDWAHAKGIPAHLHSCGQIMPFVPELVEIGMDALDPMEVKAGMDPVAIKQQFGDKLVLNGGIDASKYGDFEAVAEQIRRLVPILKQGGGYNFGSDHSVPSSVSLETFRQIVALAKELGSYR